jgi:hypothetical protein
MSDALSLSTSRIVDVVDMYAAMPEQFLIVFNLSSLLKLVCSFVLILSQNNRAEFGSLLGLEQTHRATRLRSRTQNTPLQRIRA